MATTVCVSDGSECGEQCPGTQACTAARTYHQLTDHHRDGSPFGSPVCNCLQLTARLVAAGWQPAASGSTVRFEQVRECRCEGGADATHDGPGSRKGGGQVHTVRRTAQISTTSWVADRA